MNKILFVLGVATMLVAGYLAHVLAAGEGVEIKLDEANQSAVIIVTIDVGKNRMPADIFKNATKAQKEVFLLNMATETIRKVQDDIHSNEAATDLKAIAAEKERMAKANAEQASRTIKSDAK